MGSAPFVSGIAPEALWSRKNMNCMCKRIMANKVKVHQSQNCKGAVCKHGGTLRMGERVLSFDLTRWYKLRSNLGSAGPFSSSSSSSQDKDSVLRVIGKKR